MNAAPYRKLIAAAVGLAVMLAARYGIDLNDAEQPIVDAAVAALTALGVYYFPNEKEKP